MIHEVELLCELCVCVCVCQFSVLLSDGLLRFSLCWSDTSLSFVSHFCTLPPWMDCLVFGACAEELGVSSGGNVAGLRAINLVEIARRLPTSSQRLAILSDSQVAGCPLERWEGPFWGSFLSTHGIQRNAKWIPEHSIALQAGKCSACNCGWGRRRSKGFGLSYCHAEDSNLFVVLVVHGRPL